MVRRSPRPNPIARLARAGEDLAAARRRPGRRRDAVPHPGCAAAPARPAAARRAPSPITPACWGAPRRALTRRRPPRAQGRVRTKTVKKASRVIIEKYYGRLTQDFDTNKRVVEEVAVIQTKRLRNKIAGFTTVSARPRGRGPPPRPAAAPGA
jgi:ribosomal protein S17E